MIIKKFINSLLKGGLLLILPFLITLSSCRKVVYYPSTSLIISRSVDVQLKDSALIYGRVCYAPDKKNVIPDVNVWIEEVNIKTLSNDSGYFSLKVLPGKYTIQSYMDDPSEEFAVMLNDLIIHGNEKVEVRFLRGSRSE